MISTQKQSGYKKKVPVQNDQCEKSCEIKGGSQEMTVLNCLLGDFTLVEPCDLIVAKLSS